MGQEENEQTTEAIKAAKEIEKKAKQGYLGHYGKTVALYTGFFLFYSSNFWNKNVMLGGNNYS